MWPHYAFCFSIKVTCPRQKMPNRYISEALTCRTSLRVGIQPAQGEVWKGNEDNGGRGWSVAYFSHLKSSFLFVSISPPSTTKRMHLGSTNLLTFLQGPVSIPPHQLLVYAVGEEINNIFVQVWPCGVVNIPIHNVHPQLERSQK